MQGIVFYLGIFLIDLIMFDIVLQDYIEGGLINFEKRRREFEVIVQIKFLQFVCNSYCMILDLKFIQWFQRQQFLIEEESYVLLCEIEVVVDVSIILFKFWKSMVKRFSLLFLGFDLIISFIFIKEQFKFIVSGSFGESMDFVSVLFCELNYLEVEEGFIIFMDIFDEF